MTKEQKTCFYLANFKKIVAVNVWLQTAAWSTYTAAPAALTKSLVWKLSLTDNSSRLHLLHKPQYPHVTVE
jgi:hypothetical protein